MQGRLAIAGEGEVVDLSHYQQSLFNFTQDLVR